MLPHEVGPTSGFVLLKGDSDMGSDEVSRMLGFFSIFHKLFVLLAQKVTARKIIYKKYMCRRVIKLKPIKGGDEKTR